MRTFIKSLGRWMSYPRAIILPPILAVHTLVCSAYVMLCAIAFNSPYLNYWNVKYIWAKPLVFLCGIKLETRYHSQELDQGCLFLFNHISYLDIPVLCCSLPRPFTFGAKIELFSIPIFGRAMKSLGALPITRDDRSKVMKIYKDAEKRVADGECFALAPEGARQKSLKLGEFKSGPFIFARNANMPMVPVLVAGLLDVMHSDSLLIGQGKWNHKVIVQTQAVIPALPMDLENVKDFKNELRGKLVPLYLEMNQEILK